MGERERGRSRARGRRGLARICFLRTDLDDLSKEIVFLPMMFKPDWYSALKVTREKRAEEEGEKER